MPRIYLDNAATSWPKPEKVWSDVDQYQRICGVGWGRSSGQRADEVRHLVLQLRQGIRDLIDADRGSEVLFGLNGTDVLNQAIHGILQPGDHVVTTTAEHNSVLRPLKWYEQRSGVTVSRVKCDSSGRVTAQQISDAMTPDTRLVCVIGTSNVTGAMNPLPAIGSVVDESDAFLLVDAAQTIGHSRFSMSKCKADLVAFPGHKALYGPLGTGILVASSAVQSELQPVRQGGTGSSSDSDEHPIEFPDGFEAGNHNLPGLVGLKAGLEFVRETGLDQVSRHSSRLVEMMHTELNDHSRIHILSPAADAASGIFSFWIDGLSPFELATILDSHFQIECRAGHLCASLIHDSLGSQNGCVRLSVGLFNDEAQVESTLGAIREVVSHASADSDPT